MAKITIKTPDEYCLKLSKLAAGQKEIAGKAIFAGAKILANKVRANIKAIPEDEYRQLKAGEKFRSITPREKKGILACFGVTQMHMDEDENYNVRVGFSAYIPSKILSPTKRYKYGIPAALIVRSVESGSSIRIKHPFMRPAIAAAKETAKERMATVIDEETKKIMEG